MSIACNVHSKRSFRYPWNIVGALAYLLASTSGCTTDHDLVFPNDRTWESAHFRYHSRSNDDNACIAVLEQLERHFELMQAYLGFPWPKDRKVDYYKFLDEADYLSNAGCPEDSGSCTNGSVVRSPQPLQDHELIHAYLAPLGLPPAFFVEGVASVLACEVPADTLIEPKPWQEVLLLPFSDRSHAYIEGAWFVGYLLYRYGSEQFLSLYERLSDASVSLDQITSTFELVYGETLDAVWSAGLESSDRFRCVNLWKCSGPALQLDGSPQTFARACDGSDNTRTFEMNAETDLLMSIEGPFVYAPVNCNQELPYAVSGNEIGSVNDTTLIPITPGKYFIQAIDYDSATVSVRALPARVYSQDCTQIEPIDLSTSEFPRFSFGLTIPNDGGSWFVKLNRNIVWTGANVVPIEVEECLSCGKSPVCQPLDGDAHPDAEGNVTLRLTSATPGSGYVTAKFLF